jgi:hypothetical protein
VLLDDSARCLGDEGRLTGRAVALALEEENHRAAGGVDATRRRRVFHRHFHYPFCFAAGFRSCRPDRIILSSAAVIFHCFENFLTLLVETHSQRGLIPCFERYTVAFEVQVLSSSALSLVLQKVHNMPRT